jgi:hypothetical protein
LTRCGHGSVQIILNDTHRERNRGRLLKALSSISDMLLLLKKCINGLTSNAVEGRKTI